LNTLKTSFLYTSCILLPIIPYIYAKKVKRGILIEIIVISSTLLGVEFLSQTFFNYGFPVFNFDTMIFIGIGLILFAGGLAVADSIHVLHKHLKLQ